jgi:thymidylate synthase
MSIDDYKTPTHAFETLYDLILKYGSKHQGTKAIYNASFRVQQPWNANISTPWRKFKSSYAQAEWMWYLSGDRDATEIAKRAPLWKQMMVKDTTEVNSNYGYFWQFNNQLNRVIEELKANPFSRRAIVVHYDIHELDRYKFDTPCNVSLHFQVIRGELCLTIFARSIDLVYGFCNDQYIFSKLQQLVAEAIGLNLGDMHWFISNLHIYEKHFEMKQNDI